jgi:hypothetical protein
MTAEGLGSLLRENPILALGLLVAAILVVRRLLDGGPRDAGAGWFDARGCTCYCEVEDHGPDEAVYEVDEGFYDTSPCCDAEIRREKAGREWAWYCGRCGRPVPD